MLGHNGQKRGLYQETGAVVVTYTATLMRNRVYTKLLVHTKSD
jgi:hypothetical protein